MTTWTNERKRDIPQIPMVLFNQSGITFNNAGTFFGGTNPQTTWTFIPKS